MKEDAAELSSPSGKGQNCKSKGAIYNILTSSTYCDPLAQRPYCKI